MYTQNVQRHADAQLLHTLSHSCITSPLRYAGLGSDGFTYTIIGL